MAQWLITAMLTTFAAAIGTMLYVQVDIVNRGGPVMVPILMCSVFSLAIAIERAIYFLQLHLGKNIDKYFHELKKCVVEHEWKRAHQITEKHGGPVGRVVLAGLAVREEASKEIDEAMEEAAHDELPYVEKHLRWLSTLAQIATLMGLLGTVTGLVRAFQVIQQKSVGNAPVSPGDLAGGVWEALITTVAGLVIAIPTIVAFNYFSGRVNEVMFQMEKASDLISGWRRHKSAA